MSQRPYKTIFFGTPDFSVPVLETLLALPFLKIQAVITQPDKPVGRKQALTPPPVKIIALKNKVETLQPTKLKTKNFSDKISQLAPDLCLVVAYGKIIPADLLSKPKYGWLNVHASLLPRFRGASPIQSAILAGAKTTGVTLMKIDSGLDTGPIIGQKPTPISPSDDSQTLHDKLARLGSELIKVSLLPYLEGKLNPQPQNDALATLTEIIDKTDGRIDWAKPADQIERQIRAYTPWPGAYCFWPRNAKSEARELSSQALEHRLKILKARVSEENTKLPPGQVKQVNDEMIVGCGQGNLSLQTVQLEGKKPLNIKTFLTGYPDFIQTKLS